MTAKQHDSKTTITTGGDDYDDDFVCPPSLIPHFCFTIAPSFPRNGSAGKVDRSALTKLALRYLRNQDNKNDESFALSSQDQDPFKHKTHMEFIQRIYAQSLNLPVEENRDAKTPTWFIPSSTFAEMGGDSLMAIEAAWKLSNATSANQQGCSLLATENYEGGRDRTITGADLLHLSVSAIADILEQGRDAALKTPIHSNDSKRRKIDDSNEVPSTNVLDELGRTAIRIDHRGTNQDANNNNTDNDGGGCRSKRMKPVWKCALRMCVDATPTPIDRAYAVVGSQGGDVACVEKTTGAVLWRVLCEDCKIEGSVAVLPYKHRHCRRRKNLERQQRQQQQNSNSGIMFVNSYTTNSSLNQMGGGGCIRAFELEGTDQHAVRRNQPDSVTCEHAKPANQFNHAMGAPPKLLWKKLVPGALKSKPACFHFHPRQQQQQQWGKQPQSASYSYEEQDRGDNAILRILVGDYNGSAYYCDGRTGETLFQCNDLGGAIHASPSLICDNNNSNYDQGEEEEDESYLSLFASSSWQGRITCFRVTIDSMVRIWYFDCWAPTYATPVVVNYNTNNDRLSLDATTEKRQDQQRVIFGAIDGTIRCHDMTDGTQIWSTRLPSASPIFSGCCPVTATTTTINNSRQEECIAVGSHDGHVYCLTINHGDIVWSVDCGASVLGTPILMEDDSLVVVTTTAGFVVSIHVNTGVIFASLTDPLDGEVFGSPMIDSTTKCLFVGCR
eukprot:CAMPEP_0195542650 /NCGR_PEP_ID=MMETSP0794_2-20130614/51711_1 /TAXON_ID=515487 /ORGANISM="Stephanopyxis turris, Strain CCMP 815" /LENGTH=726 /DNA_ID=CAMNT_0040676785 /DNA_START=314 /DNA_END=2491 /DNA_ORIENTATION=+